jgi:hypothetical protein
VENLEIQWSSNFSSQQQGDASSSLEAFVLRTF